MPEPRMRPNARLKPERAPDNPWLIRGIVIGAIVVVAAGLIWAAAIGHLFT